MKDKQRLIDEFFDVTTPRSRKDEIEREISHLSDFDSVRVLFELGKTVQAEDEVENLRRRIRAIEEPAKKTKPLWLKMAASLLLLISITAILIKLLPDSNSNQAIFQRHYSPYDGVVIARDEAMTINKGILAYKEGDFKLALLELGQIEQPTSQSQLVISSCHLSLGNWDLAIATLNEIKNTESQMVQDNRDWYLAIAYLRIDKIEQSYTLLRGLTERNTGFRGKAEGLLSEPSFKEMEQNQED